MRVPGDTLDASNASVKCVLVTGDSSDAIAAYLANTEWSAEISPDGKQVLKRLGQRRYQAVLCDIDLSGIGVMKLVSRIRADFPDVAVLVVTPPEKLRQAVLATFSGASGYLLTPFQPGALASALDNAMLEKKYESALRSLATRRDPAPIRRFSPQRHVILPSAAEA